MKVYLVLTSSNLLYFSSKKKHMEQPKNKRVHHFLTSLHKFALQTGLID